jgi:hypothetical protein
MFLAPRLTKTCSLRFTLPVLICYWYGHVCDWQAKKHKRHQRVALSKADKFVEKKHTA